MNFFEYDGKFIYNGETIKYKITDDESPIRNVRGVEKIKRYIHFYSFDDKIIYTRAIYGDFEHLSNITNYDALEWYKESLKNINHS